MKKKESRLLILIICIFLCSCKNKLNNDIKFVQNLSNDVHFNIPFYNESLIIFISIDDIIIQTSLRELYTIKTRKYSKYKDFDSFLVTSLNNNLLIKSDFSLTSNLVFELNKNIMNEYNKKGLIYLKETYCEKSNDHKKYYIKSDLNLNIKQSLMYIFFKNNYYVMQNDHSGKFVLIDKN